MDRLGELLWGFMNTCISGLARVAFENSGMLNGFDAWRAIVQEIQRSRFIQLNRLRKIVRSQPPIVKGEDVSNGILKFENNISEYVAAGGERPNDKEMKNDLLETLPLEIRENLVWRIPANEPFSAFRDHARTSANEVLYHRSKFKTVNTLDVQDQATENKFEDIIGAIMKKMC